MRVETLRYEADGLKMIGYLYMPPDIVRPTSAMLVFPEAFGLNAHAKSRAARLAEQGVVALACDLHGDERCYPDPADTMRLTQPLRDDPDRIRDRAQGGLDALLARPEVDRTRIGAIGFCFGGTMALELARSGADIAAVVGFHSGLAASRPWQGSPIHPRILICTGADDPSVPLEQRVAFEEEMRAAGTDWQMHLYGGVVHGFTNPDIDRLGMPTVARYDEVADRRSWNAMRAFLPEIFDLSAAPQSADTSSTEIQRRSFDAR